MHAAPASAARPFSLNLPAAALGLLVLSAFLGACASVPGSAVSRGTPAAVIEPVAAQQDLLLQLLAGQFAVQDNDLPSAAGHFAAAAALSDDPAVGEEATRLALATSNWVLAKSALARWQALSPSDPGVVQARAWIAIGENRFDDAYTDLDILARQGDDHVWRLIAQVLLGGADKAAAARLLDRLATPEHLGSREANWIAVSQLAFKLDDKVLSRRLADAAVERFHGADGFIWSARLALDRDDGPAARAIYQQGLKHEPTSSRLRNGYAALLAEGGDNQEAARVLARGPQDDISYGARAAYASRAQDAAALSALYREMVADSSPRSDKRLYLLGQLAEMTGRRADALDWYQQVSEDSDQVLDARIRQVVVLDQLGRDVEAFAVLKDLENRAAGDREVLGNIYLLEAELFTRKNRLKDAEAALTRGLTVLPDDPRLLYARALFQVEHGDSASGEQDLRRLVQLEPDNAEALNALGYTLADRSRKGDAIQAEALTLIEKALKLKPDEPAIIDSLGWLRYRMGDLASAADALRRAYEKLPDAEIAAHLGEVLWTQGKRDEARRIWAEARSKDGNNKTLLETIGRLSP